MWKMKTYSSFEQAQAVARRYVRRYGYHHPNYQPTANYLPIAESWIPGQAGECALFLFPAEQAAQADFITAQQGYRIVAD